MGVGIFWVRGFGRRDGWPRLQKVRKGGGVGEWERRKVGVGEAIRCVDGAEGVWFLEDEMGVVSLIVEGAAGVTS